MKDEELRALYAAARREEAPSLEDRRAVRGAVLSAVAAAAATGATAASAVAAPAAVSALTAGKVATWLGLGFALGALTSTGAVAVRSFVHEAPVPATSALVASGRTHVRPPTGRVEPTPDSAISAQPPVVPQSPALPSPRAAAGAPAPRDGTSSSLPLETAALARVQGELSRGDPEQALRLLREQDREFARGALGEERAAARVLALCSLGETAQARAARRAFVQRYPRSALMKRVQGTCAE